MRISVVIPMYNSVRTIKAVLDSIYAQTAFEHILEIIIVDDGSTDESSKIVKNYINSKNDDIIKYHYQSNKGVSAARNQGIKIAEGDYIALLDSDDIWLPLKIEKQVQILKNNPDIMFLGCSTNDGPFKIGLKKYPELFNANIKMLCIKSFPTVPSVLFKRNAIDTIGLFDENMQYSEDMNYFHRFCTSFNYWFLPEKLVEIGIEKNFDSQSGLSSNIRKMHLGRKRNMHILYEENSISLFFFLNISIFNEIKFITYYTLNKLGNIEIFQKILKKILPKV